MYGTGGRSCLRMYQFCSTFLLPRFICTYPIFVVATVFQLAKLVAEICCSLKFHCLCNVQIEYVQKRLLVPPVSCFIHCSMHAVGRKSVSRASCYNFPAVSIRSSPSCDSVILEHNHLPCDALAIRRLLHRTILLQLPCHILYIKPWFFFTWITRSIHAALLKMKFFNVLPHIENRRIAVRALQIYSMIYYTVGLRC